MSLLAQAMKKYAEVSGANQHSGNSDTCLPGVHFYHDPVGCDRQPLTYQSGIIVIGQGVKHIYLGDELVKYGQGDYLVLGVPLPLECEAFCEPGEPILGLTIDVPPTLLHEMVSQLSHGEDFQRQYLSALDRGLQSVAIAPSMEQACVRLLEALQSNTEAQILGPGLVKEVIYRALVGPHGHTLIGLARHDGQYARIAKVLTRLHKDFAEPVQVEQLAADANMSVTSFHRAFRQVTRASPLQYVKQIRLNKARSLIATGRFKVAEVANQVGYNSTTQFNREFKRHFAQTPKTASA